MLKAHRAAKEARHWGDIGRCWFHYFLDFDRAESCFSKAVEIASTGLTVPTVEYRIREVDDEGRVVRHVIGHRMVPTGAYLHSLFSVIFCLAGETDEQLETMAKAEGKAEDVRSSLRSFGGFDEDDLGYFDKAEYQLGWLHIAKVWAVDHENRQQALRCLARAEELADDMSTTTNWVEVAKVWMRVMGDPGEAHRCVAEAERLIEEPDVRDYIDLAEGVAVVGDPELPVQYLDKAESLIDELSDWSAIAFTWEELGYFDRAERANNIGEYLSSKVSQEGIPGQRWWLRPLRSRRGPVLRWSTACSGRPALPVRALCSSSIVGRAIGRLLQPHRGSVHRGPRSLILDPSTSGYWVPWMTVD